MGDSDIGCVICISVARDTHLSRSPMLPVLWKHPDEPVAALTQVADCHTHTLRDHASSQKSIVYICTSYMVIFSNPLTLDSIHTYKVHYNYSRLFVGCLGEQASCLF